MSDELRIIMVVGLPGSGKSHLARDLAAQLNAELIDDPKPGDITWGPRTGTLIISDPALCHPVSRSAAMEMIASTYPGASLEWIAFEPDVSACCRNVDLRNDGRAVDVDIRVWSRHYRLDDLTALPNCRVVPVWTPPGDALITPPGP